jgi:3',5'-nucleoside bisphosphate phosphatase
MLNVDLHCHSSISDGTLLPADVAAQAKAGGVQVWALTDHDEVRGVAAARAAAKELGIRHVAGVEISATWGGQTVHIVGLQIDENNPTLVSGLAHTRSGRERRAREIARQLGEAGIPDAYEGALAYVGNADLMSRTHFARFLVARGLAPDIGAVFRNYLSAGNPGYVPHQWASLEDAVGWIRGAGGIAVIAHPGRYKFSDLAFGEFFDAFKQLGGAAIEVMTGSHTVEQYAQYADVANHYGFLASRGSDFHGPGESRVGLGALPHLPAKVRPVWHDWDL